MTRSGVPPSPSPEGSFPPLLFCTSLHVNSPFAGQVMPAPSSKPWIVVDIFIGCFEGMGGGQRQRTLASSARSPWAFLKPNLGSVSALARKKISDCIFWPHDHARPKKSWSHFGPVSALARKKIEVPQFSYSFFLCFPRGQFFLGSVFLYSR